jgi:hypothetical protein
MKSEIHFRVTYDGPDLAAARMDVAHLAALGMIGGGAVGLIALLKKIRGRQVERVEPRAEQIAIVTAEETLLVDRATGLLYANRKLRGHLKEGSSQTKSLFFA